MWAALQGKISSPSHVNPYSGLNNPRITSRCAHVRSCINSLPLKDLHEFFPYLLANVFGFDHGTGWQLRGFSQKLHTDFQLLLKFFSPDDDLFQLIAKLESARYLYEFPITCLPPPSQLSLTEGNVPPLYNDKVNHSSPTRVLLTPFEYYIFHFAYYLIFSQSKTQLSLSPVPVSDSLYTHLLEKYLNHFLPPTGTLPPALTTSQRQGSPHHQSSTPPGFSSTPSRHHTPGLLKINGEAEPHMVAMGTAGDQREAPLVQAEVVVQVLVEFWLNQNNYNGCQGDILAQAQNQFVPNEEHLLLARRLMKHIHYFSNGISSNSPHHTLIPLTDALRRNVIPTFVQKQLYYFLRYSFRHSPLDNTFRYILELWLTYVQPWRYTDPLKPSSENKDSLESIPKKWRGFVLDNFAFFSALLMEIIGRSFQLDLTSDHGATLLFRVSKVFSQTGLMGFVEYGESLLLNPDPPYSSPRNSPVVDACSIKALFMDLDGPMFNYQPLFEDDALAAIQVLLDKVREARAVLTSRLSSRGFSTQQTSVQPPPPLPATPTTTSTAPAALTGKKTWWKSVGDFFSDAPSSPSLSPSPSPSPAADPSKLLSILENTESNLMTMFRLSSPPLYSPSDGSPQWRPDRYTSVTPLRLATPTSSAPSDTLKSLAPEYVRGTTQLTPTGKMQLIQGLRKTSNLHIPYLGDPLLQPVRSYENTTLARWLYRLSCQLNHKFSRQLQAIGTSNSFMSRLAKSFLSPPPPSPYCHAVMDTNEPPQTPKSKVSHVLTVPAPSLATLPSHAPRINLRSFASYYTVSSMGLAVVFLWLVLVPLWVMILVLLLSTFACCAIGCGRESKNGKAQ